MKKARAITLFLVVFVCAFFLVYRTLRPDQDSGNSNSSQTSEAQCDQGLWQFVYNPARLQVLAQCVSVTGTVDEVRKEADGDIHILFRVDQEFASLLNEKNISRQNGDLVLEPICQGKVTQTDAAEPCSPYVGPYFEPQVGQRYRASGSFVHDADHGWNELHPVSSMDPIETSTP